MALIPREQIPTDFDDEEQERDDLFIEKMVHDFRDEPPVEHDVYPESDDERNEDVQEREHIHIRRGDEILYKKQTFFNGVAFKECVLDYALRTGRNLTQYRYDKDKIGFKCLGGADKGSRCPWQVYATILPKDAIWRTTVFVDKHTCIPSGDVDIFKVPVIARMFLDRIRDEPKYFLPLKIKETIKERFGINVSRPQCQSGRLKAFKWIETEYDHQFARLRDYAAEIVANNKGYIVVIDTVKNADGQDVFSRFYVCFDILRRTWKQTCRPLLGVDGCFLKDKMKGQFLVAVGRDADNAIYPVAWGVVEVENIENWTWFVKMLKSDLDLNDGDGYIIVSDRQKGLIKAVKTKLPNAEHRKCVRHIYGNLKKNHGSKTQMKPLLWNLAWSYNEADYAQHLEKLFCYDSRVYGDVMKMLPQTWCRAFYKLGNYCEDVENNSTESFNCSIEKARKKPFVPMLEMVRRLAMVRISERSAKSHAHKRICTPYVEKFLAKEKEKAKECRVTRSTNGMFEVSLSGCSYRVSLEKRTCSCMKWDICGIPCEHGYGVILKQKGLLAENFVCHWFRTEMWKRNYTKGLVPLRGARFWPSTEGPNVHPPSVPVDAEGNPITKQDKKRKKGKNESPTKKQPKEKKKIMHCGIYGSPDHNSRFHKKEIRSVAKSSQAQSSQAALSSQPHSSQAQSSQGDLMYD